MTTPTTNRLTINGGSVSGSPRLLISNLLGCACHVIQEAIEKTAQEQLRSCNINEQTHSAIVEMNSIGALYRVLCASLIIREILAKVEIYYPWPMKSECESFVEFCGVDKMLTEDVMQIYFENTRKSGGGQVARIFIDHPKRMAHIKFLDKQAAWRVVYKFRHRINGVEILATYADTLPSHKPAKPSLPPKPALVDISTKPVPIDPLEPAPEKSALVDPSKDPASVDRSENPASVDPSENPASVNPSENPASVDPSENPASVDPSENPASVDPSENPASVHPSENPASVDPSENPASVDPSENPASVDPSEDSVSVDPSEDSVSVDQSEDSVSVNPSEDSVSVDPSEDPAPVDPSEDPASVDPSEDPASVDPSEDPASVHPSEDPASVDPSEDPASVDRSEDPASVDPSEDPASVDPSEDPASVDRSEDPASVDPSEDPASVDPSEEPASVDPSEDPASVDPSEDPASVDPSEDPASVDPSENPASVDQSENQRPSSKGDITATPNMQTVPGKPIAKRKPPPVPVRTTPRLNHLFVQSKPSSHAASTDTSLPTPAPIGTALQGDITATPNTQTVPGKPIAKRKPPPVPVRTTPRLNHLFAQSKPSSNAVTPETTLPAPVSTSPVFQSANITMSEDTGKCFPYGSCWLPDGGLLITDCCNNRLKRLNAALDVVAHLDLPGVPFGVCYNTARREAAVSLQWKKLIQFVRLKKRRLALSRNIKTNYECYGVVSRLDELWWVGSVDEKLSSVHVVDWISGKCREQILPHNEAGRVKMSKPRHMAVSDSGDTVYITSYDDALLIIKRDGTLVRVIEDLVVTYGVCQGDTDTVFVCGNENVTPLRFSVVQYDSDGRRVKELVSEKQLTHVCCMLGLPTSLSYNGASLAVTLYDRDYIAVFHLK